MAVAILVSSSEGLCLDGLLGAILLRAAMIAVAGYGGEVDDFLSAGGGGKRIEW